MSQPELKVTAKSLLELLEAAKDHTCTEEEKEQQIISFAYGNVKLCNPEITRELVEAEYRKLKVEGKI